MDQQLLVYKVDNLCLGTLSSSLVVNSIQDYSFDFNSKSWDITIIIWHREGHKKVLEQITLYSIATITIDIL